MSMGFRFRRSMSLGRLVRINISKKGIGASVGVPGFRVSLGADGKLRQTIGIPGTGLSHTEVLDGPAPKASARRCVACGRRLGKTARFCPDCGAPQDVPRDLSQDMTAQLEEPPNPRPARIYKYDESMAEKRALVAQLAGLIKNRIQQLKAMDPDAEEKAKKALKAKETKEGCLGCLVIVIGLFVVSWVISALTPDAPAKQTGSFTGGSEVKVEDIQTPARPADSPEATSGLGVTRKEVIDLFEKPEIGFTFQEAEPVDGLPKMLGISPEGLAVLAVIGNPNDISRLTLSIMVVSDDSNAVARNGAYALGLLSVYAPGSEQWFTSQLDSLVDITSDVELSTTVGDRLVSLCTVRTTGTLLISIEPAKPSGERKIKGYAYDVDGNEVPIYEN